MHPSAARVSRREFIELTTAGAAVLSTVRAFAIEAGPGSGLLVGQRQAAETAARVLADGGNAVDAAVAGAFVAGVVALQMCGIGGYGGHAVIGWPDGRCRAIDFNSAAPAAARPDMYPLDEHGKVRGAVNSHGWLAAGVPGTLAGLQLALDRFGTRKLSSVIEPAIRFARDGFVVDAPLVRAINAAAPDFKRDPASASLFFAAGAPLAQGTTFRNPDLAAMLEQLAKDNSVAAFYRGDIAGRIARQFGKHGGLVTEQDLASYEAREVEPITSRWRDSSIHTAPLTAGGLSVVQALSTLKALKWENTDPADPKSTHARVEALRLAWHDRLSLLGDPQASEVPVARLLSDEYATASAERVRKAVADKALIPTATDGRSAGGTIHLSACDAQGMMVALTLTHGEGFGARVTVDGLGVTLGHGMSRFEPKPGHPNSPHPGSRPLNNMCPTIVMRGDRPVAALGATGGRRIPNTLYDVLVNFVGRGASLSDAAATPRMHTEGGPVLQLAKGWNAREVDYLKQIGYTIEPGSGANFNAVYRDPESGAISSVART
jgi:gamma-glutamyltranspeptidase / glutathione hydrolase